LPDSVSPAGTIRVTIGLASRHLPSYDGAMHDGRLSRHR